MTTIINIITTTFLSSSSNGAVYDEIAVIAVTLLLTLLIEKVLLDAYEGRPIEYKTHAFSIVILPLLFVMVVIAFFRIAQILHLL